MLSRGKFRIIVTYSILYKRDKQLSQCVSDEYKMTKWKIWKMGETNMHFETSDIATTEAGRLFRNL